MISKIKKKSRWKFSKAKFLNQFFFAKIDFLKSEKKLLFQKSKFLKIDCSENVETCSECYISGYPTLKLYKNGKPVQDYLGNRQKGFLPLFCDGFYFFCLVEKNSGIPEELFFTGGSD